MLKGVVVDVEAEEWRRRMWTRWSALLPKKIYEEPESCGSAANFLLGEEMEGDSTGRMEVEAGAHPLKINDSNKFHLFPSIASPPAVNHDQADDLSCCPYHNCRHHHCLCHHHCRHCCCCCPHHHHHWSSSLSLSSLSSPLSLLLSSLSSSSLLSSLSLLSSWSWSWSWSWLWSWS